MGRKTKSTAGSGTVALRHVAEILARKGINPVSQLIDLAQSGRLRPYQEAEVWRNLLEYTVAKPKLAEEGTDPETFNPADDMSNEVLTQALRAAYAKGDHLPGRPRAV